MKELRPVMSTMLKGVALAMTVSLIWVGAVAAAPLTPAQQCEKLKNLHAAKRALCTAVQRAKEIAGKPFDYAACSTALATKFVQLEQSAIDHGGACPTTGAAEEIDARIDGVFNPDNAIPKAFSGVRFVDNGDGTVTDTGTGLMWEKKDGNGIHAVLNQYRWSASGTAADGTVFTSFLSSLNSSIDPGSNDGCFAEHCDWRLPTVAELLTIVAPNLCAPQTPCIDQTIFGPTQLNDYWSLTTYSGLPVRAYAVSFISGNPLADDKGLLKYVRRSWRVVIARGSSTSRSSCDVDVRMISAQ